MTPRMMGDVQQQEQEEARARYDEVLRAHSLPQDTRLRAFCLVGLQ